MGKFEENVKPREAHILINITIFFAGVAAGSVASTLIFLTYLYG